MQVCRTQYDEDRDEYLRLRSRVRVRERGASSEPHGSGPNAVMLVAINPDDTPADDDLITVPDEAPPGWP